MNSRTVLIVEDNEDDFLLLKRAFSKAAIRAKLDWSRNGDEARHYLLALVERKAEEEYPVLILADLKMPQVDGFEFLRWLRSRSDLRRIPVVVLTSSNQGLDINRAYDIGANSYLVKPGRFEDLMELSHSLKQYWLMLNRSPQLPES
jgi:CheY-like chemotaxis protein